MIVNILVILKSNSQTTFNASGQSLVFSSTNEIHLNAAGNGKGGNGTSTDGTNENDKTFYQNVITIGGIQIHCVVTTVDLTSNTTYTTFDDNTYTNYFSPRFDFGTSSGQSARLKFEFFRDGTYSSSNRTYTGGTAVTLQNLYINTYDIDGNNNSNSQQSVAFSEEVDYTTESNNLLVSNNTPNGFKEFKSQTTTNSNNIFDNQNRVRVEYEAVSSFEVIIGGGNGAAHYYFDFSMGAAWASLLDLHTTELGVDNSATVTGNSVANFTNNDTSNVISSSVISYFDIEYTTSELLNGSNELLIINGATSGSSLSYNRTANHNFTFNSSNYRIVYDAGNPTLLRFYKLNGSNTTTMTEAEGLALVNAFQYQNTAGSPTGGNRVFELTFRNSTLTSNVALFNVNIPIALPINILSFNATKSEQNVELDWVVNQEKNFSHFEVFHSNDGYNFNQIGKVNSTNSNFETNTYQFVDSKLNSGISFYKLKIVDNDGTYSWSKIVTIENNNKPNKISIFPNPAHSFVNINMGELALENFTLQVIDISGKVILSETNSNLNSEILNIDLSDFSNGIYSIKILSNNELVSIEKFIKY